MSSAQSIKAVGPADELPARTYDASGLKAAGLANGVSPSALQTLAQNFAIGLSPHLVKLIRETGQDGPVARQYLPDVRELVRLPDETSDPIGDGAHSPVKGIVHRYPDRVLLKIVNVCAVYCRFCFRRELIGPGSEGLKADEIQAALAYIKARPEVQEVILTGGDPLVLSPARLESLIEALNDISHVKILRIHTRVPVADPQRLTALVLKALSLSNKSVYVALHINHEDEITPDVEEAVRAMRRTGCTLLSQSVLLRGINDDPAVLEALFHRLVILGVIPYELHHPDKAQGTGHFRLSLAEGRAIVGRLRGTISGLCQPHYMLDIPGGHGKVEVLSHKVRLQPDGSYLIEDYLGKTHVYEDL